MMKAYPQYQQRRVDSLNDLWDFRCYPGKSMDEITVPVDFGKERLPGPGAFDVFPAWLGQRGTGVYRKEISVEPGTAALLEFEAVSFACRILVDGECLAEHFCGYSPFSVRVPPSESRTREVVVLAENRFDFDRIPMHEHHFDFRQYGGIIRPVWLHHLPENPLEEVRVEVLDAAAGRIRVSGRCAAGTLVEARVLEEDLRFETVADAEGRFVTEGVIPDPKLWSPESPDLYRVRISTEEDAVIHRIGLRHIETRGKDVLLNGKPLRLWGFNRHEFHPNFGPSTPPAQQVADIQLLKDCGSNFVRGSHYQQSQLFLDFCDELGLLVWEENLGWGQAGRQVTNERFLAHHQQSMAEMVERSYHHPSVIIWGFLNEGPSEEDCFRPVLETTRAYCREHGGNRLFAYASNRIERDRYFAEVDLICVNLYPGWYGAEGHPDPLSLIPKDFQKFIDHLERTGLGDTPLLISEIGCEGLFGVKDEYCDFHSEDYQEAYLGTVCREIAGNPRFLGVCIWHFSDTRTREHSVGRTRGYNNKGVFDELRRPKLARNTVREIFRSVR